MKKYRFKFRGRQTGAIGIFYTISDTYKCDSLGEAKSLLYEDYEHIGEISITENGKPVSIEDFDKAEFIKVRSNLQRARLSNGQYKLLSCLLYTSDAADERSS